MGNSWADRLLAVGAFLGFFGAYLSFFRGPAANQAQLFFRIGLAAVGLILAAVGLILKSSHDKSDDA